MDSVKNYDIKHIQQNIKVQKVVILALRASFGPPAYGGMAHPMGEPSNLLHTTHSSRWRPDSNRGRHRPDRRTEKYLIMQFVYSKTNITGW